MCVGILLVYASHNTVLEAPDCVLVFYWLMHLTILEDQGYELEYCNSDLLHKNYLYLDIPFKTSSVLYSTVLYTRDCLLLLKPMNNR